MWVLAEVHKVRHFNGPKLKAEVSLIVSEPDQLIRLRLFAVHEGQGVIQRFEGLQGKTARIPLEVDLYRGQLTYSLSYGGMPEAAPQKAT